MTITYKLFEYFYSNIFFQIIQCRTMLDWFEMVLFSINSGSENLWKLGSGNLYNSRNEEKIAFTFHNLSFLRKNLAT